MQWIAHIDIIYKLKPPHIRHLCLFYQTIQDLMSIIKKYLASQINFLSSSIINYIKNINLILKTTSNKKYHITGYQFIKWRLFNTRRVITYIIILIWMYINTDIMSRYYCIMYIEHDILHITTFLRKSIRVKRFWANK